MGDFPDIPFVQAAGDGGLRTLTQMIVIHATDNTASDEAEASYATHRPDQISAHFYNDEDSVIQGVRLSNIAYGCYPTGNGRSVQFELCGLSGKLTDATLRRIAPIVRRVCDRYGIPIRKVSPTDLRQGVRGICGHADVTLAWGEGTHTDPGAGFPWTTFIGYVAGGSMAFIDDQNARFLAYREHCFAEWVDRVTTNLGEVVTHQGVTKLKALAADVATLKARPEVTADALAKSLAGDPVFVSNLAKQIVLALRT